MGMSNRAVTNAFLRLQGVCDLTTSEPSRDTSDQPEDLSSRATKDHNLHEDSPSVSQAPSSDSIQDGPEKMKQEENKRSRGRLTELEEQLVMAESRCGTLKQQLDYMRVLYQGVDRTRTHPSLPGFSMEQTHETPVKVKKEKRHHKKRPMTESNVGGVVSSLTTTKSERSPHRQHESAVPDSKMTSSPREDMVFNVRMCSLDEPPIRDLIDFSDHAQPPADKVVRQNNKEASQAAVQAMQDILCGMTHSVNETADDFEHETRPQKAEKGHKRHKHRPPKHLSHTLIEEDEDENVVSKEVNSMIDMRPYAITASEPTLDDIYSKRFQKVYANESLTRKGAKTAHAPRKDHPYGLTIPSPSHDVDSDDSVRVKVKRKKTSSKKTEKKSKTSGPYTQTNVANKVNDDGSVVTAKPKKKKLIKTRHSNSRSTLKSQRKNTDPSETIPAYSSEQAAYENWRDNSLVELYHNTAIKTETSVSEEHIRGTFNDSDTPSVISYLKKTREEPDIASRLGKAKPDMTVATVRVDKDRRSVLGKGCEAAVSTVSQFRAVHRDSSKVSHFELPTVSSRMKQVDRSYYQRFNFRNIPFVVGKSTTPSHNLGLNIQQVLSIIKTRQPVVGMSPMALAGGLLRESQMPSNLQRPITAMLTRMSSRPVTSHRNVACPPTIPEHDELELPQHDDDEGCQDFEAHRSSYREPGPLTSMNMGLMREAASHEEFETYRADWGKKTTNSTAFPAKKYNNYHHVLNQYLGGEQLSFLQNANAASPTRARTSSHAYRGRSQPRKGEGEEFNKTLHNQMKGMKEVMQKLHDDFTQLSRDYEQLCETVERDETGMLIHEEDHETLKEMAAAVQNKENEIKLVMELLQEVSTLHKMVATLNQKTSIASMTGRVGTSTTQGSRQRRIIPREPTTSVRLTRLLRTIQSFQEKLKQEK